MHFVKNHWLQIAGWVGLLLFIGYAWDVLTSPGFDFAQVLGPGVGC